ncbi:peptidoglycan recognition protein family protein [Aetokthonos hydrillicola Thurmond2011]|jgi:hypothetical protein|uniref:N-acetylmuramoyl-L-alanine amidase n=1 Tax=Aetokthonos hydrillicola Thurmond2011 TaxID=2712845 RepID=A0AAP5I743_9CYAN|nr:peptidoglycan recognition family protein [Aetokthonos hydrillicola]MBO3461655.1 N-acetylmuramoyl-L-alanine amidase [Aetokthonos hydrillicola CCALA 1050]MBW4588732.1 peptidoglycan recognition protein family protein [Aetokthonos hydrillicola CCALA 1050]MDR9895934.1 peptidoglycan recognition protein family protein [Aetokthonos hydrillicola Thurmond2011]
MRFRVRAKSGLLFLLPLVCVIVCVLLAGTAQIKNKTVAYNTSGSETTVWNQYPNPHPNPSVELTTNNKGKPQSADFDSQISTSASKSQAVATSQINTIASVRQYRPKYKIAWANPTNYGDRFNRDVNGVAVNNQPIIVLHETDASASSVINFFQEPHQDESVQASYHTMIQLDGTVVYIVPPEKRAFGAANSEFNGSYGLEAVQTNPQLPSSVNNFAYHVSLETPPDGHMNTEPTHSSYTEAQYRSLAWLIAQSNVPDERITTHKAVDRSGQKIDPRSFDFDKFFNLLHEYRLLALDRK